MKLPIDRNGLPRMVPEFILQQYSCGINEGQFEAFTLSVDISGFTSLTETLLKFDTGGAELLGITLEKVFSTLVRQVLACGGLIPLYAGDAFTAIFPNPASEDPNFSQEIWNLARRTQDYFTQDGDSRLFPTNYGRYQIGVRIGLAVGSVHWGILGFNNFHTYYFRGPAIDRANVAQKKGRQGTIAIHKSFIPYLLNLPVGGGKSTVQILTKNDLSGSPIEPYHESIQLPVQTIEQLRPFIPTAVLNLPVEAEFREICPVFITFDPLDDSNNLHQWISRVIAATNKYGGTFGQLEFNERGGVIVLWFGAPISYENNAARAAECLLAIRDRASIESPPVWRAGFTYGLVWAGLRGAEGRREYGAIGDVVNTAARIANTAAPGQIWLDDAAANRLKANYQLQLLGLFKLKGKESAVPLYQLMAAKTQLHIMFQGQMVGRENELEELMMSISPIFKGHFGGASYVFGDAGMGKSRLVYELRQHLSRWVFWASCPAEEILRQSLNPVRHFLRDFFSQVYDQDEARKKETFEIILEELLQSLADSSWPEAAGLHQELNRTRSLLAALLDIYWPDSLYEQLTPKLRADNTIIALSTLFKTLALERPLLIHLEDSHWLDADSENLLRTLSHQLQGFPAAFLFTSRYLEDGSQPKPKLAPDIPEAILELKKLNHQEVRAIAEQLLDLEIGDDVIELLVEKSSGQPFFAEQFILDLHECGMLRKRDGRITLVDKTSTYLPSSLNAVLVTRLDRLNPAVKQVVHAASILGERFSVPVLAAILEQDKQLMKNLQIAADKQIWTMVDELRYLFKHALLRDAAYHMQLHSRRRDLHRLAAETYKRLYSHNLKPYYSQIAYHYDTAYQQGLTQVIQKASIFQFKAGQQAFEAFEHEAALHHLKRALALTPGADKKRRFKIIKLRENIHSLLSDRPAQKRDLEILAQLAEENPDPAWQSEVALLHAEYANSMSDYETAITLAKWAVRQAQKNRDAYRQVLGYLGWARALIWQRDFTAAQEPLDRAYDLTRANELIDLEAEILRDLGYISGQLGDYKKGKRFTEKARQICHEMGNLSSESANLSNLGGMYLDEGNYSTAQTFIEAALAIFRQMGKRLNIAICLLGLGELFCHQGKYRQAEANFKEAIDYFREGGNQKLETAGLYWLGLVHLYLNDVQEAYRYHELALKLVAPASPDEADVHYGLGKTLAALGQYEEAEEHLDQAIQLRRRAGYYALAIEATAELAHLAYQQRKLSEAFSLLDETLAYLERGGHLDGTVAPFRIYLHCYRILQEIDLAKANQLLENAYQQIMQRAERIEGKNGRDSYLQVSWHRTIIDEWEQLNHHQADRLTPIAIKN